MDCHLIDFEELGDERGLLVALEALRNVPFTIQRAYCIYGTKSGVSRGFHAHKELHQLMVCVNGSCNVILDNGKKKQVFHMNSPQQGMFIDKMIWHEMHDFSEDCVLLVLADDYYDEEDYIRDYQRFLDLKKLMESSNSAEK